MRKVMLTTAVAVAISLSMSGWAIAQEAPTTPKVEINSSTGPADNNTAPVVDPVSSQDLRFGQSDIVVAVGAFDSEDDMMQFSAVGPNVTGHTVTHSRAGRLEVLVGLKAGQIGFGINKFRFTDSSFGYTEVTIPIWTKPSTAFQEFNVEYGPITHEIIPEGFEHRIPFYVYSKDPKNMLVLPIVPQGATVTMNPGPGVVEGLITWTPTALQQGVVDILLFTLSTSPNTSASALAVMRRIVIPQTAPNSSLSPALSTISTLEMGPSFALGYPILGGDPEGKRMALTANGADVNGVQITRSVPGVIEGLISIQAGTTPGINNLGVALEDEDGSARVHYFQNHTVPLVSNLPTLFTYVSGNGTVKVNQPMQFILVAQDSDQEPLAGHWVVPPGAVLQPFNLNGIAAVIGTWTPTAQQLGPWEVQGYVEDTAQNRHNSAHQTIRIFVIP